MSESAPRRGARSEALRRRRFRRAAAVVLGVAVTSVAVLVGVLNRSPDPGRNSAEPSSAPTRLESLDLSDLPVARGPFCDALDEDDVKEALGSAPSDTAHYESGERAVLTVGVRDLSHEYDCTFSAGTGEEARVWVFAEPVTRRVALTLAREARAAKGCREVAAAPAFGRPSVSTECRAAGGRAVTLRGLFGDAWLSCRLTTTAGDTAPETVRRAEQWCVRVATTIGARP